MSTEKAQETIDNLTHQLAVKDRINHELSLLVEHQREDIERLREQLDSLQEKRLKQLQR